MKYQKYSYVDFRMDFTLLEISLDLHHFLWAKETDHKRINC